jgi:pyridoxine 4-dehydrogenase
MQTNNNLAGQFTFKGTSLAVNRIGYGAIQLTGPMAWGDPPDRAEALAVVKEVLSLGINHIDTSDFYGPHTANRIIREAIHPYPENLVIVTKVGTRRGADKSWPKALSAEELTSAVNDNLRNLGVEALDIVNLRVGQAQGTDESSISEPLKVLVGLKKKGLIRNIGLSNISHSQFKEAESITDIVCVQNQYNLVYRKDEALIDELAVKGIAFVPFFPMGGFRPIRSDALERLASQLNTTSKQVALAWLLQRSPNILLIPGTSSVAHLRENAQAGTLKLTGGIVSELDRIFKS